MAGATLTVAVVQRRPSGGALVVQSPANRHDRRRDPGIRIALYVSEISIIAFPHRSWLVPRAGLKIPWPATAVPVRVRQRAPIKSITWSISFSAPCKGCLALGRQRLGNLPKLGRGPRRAFRKGKGATQAQRCRARGPTGTCAISHPE